jgi:hypothetical protein
MAQQGTLAGRVRYLQDFGGWEQEFPSDLVFTIQEDRSPPVRRDFWLTAFGYGERGNYGNGAIVLSQAEFWRVWRSIDDEFKRAVREGTGE